MSKPKRNGRVHTLSPKQPKPAKRPAFNPPRWYGRCDRCHGAGYLFRIFERVVFLPGQPPMRRRQLDAQRCVTCAGVGSVVKTGPVKRQAAVDVTIPRIVSIETI
jgi:hypothetical protein